MPHADRSTVNPTDRDVALAFYRAQGGDIKKAARLANVEPRTLKRWVTEELDRQIDDNEPKPERVVIAEAVNSRPRPPADLTAPLNFAQDFRPAPDVESWIIENILSPLGPIYNPDHHHLNAAQLGVVWTNVPMRKQGKDVLGQCEKPMTEGDWSKARTGFTLTHWFGKVPDFVITLYAPFAGRCKDVLFCALIEHELYHCGQAKDQYGSPRFHKDSGKPVFAIAGHDIEQFKGVRRRYGATNDAEREYDQAVLSEPTISNERIELACGTCLKA